MVILIGGRPDALSDWRDTLRPLLPEADLRLWPEVGDPAEVRYVLWRRPKTGELGGLPNLKAIFTMSAGVDHITDDLDLPAGVPIVRCVEGSMIENTVAYVLMWTLFFHRSLHLCQPVEGRRRWDKAPRPDPSSRRVGVLGLGVIGGEVALTLRRFGFVVAGWSRRAKSIPGVESFVGEEGLMRLLARSDTLVCVLPLTGETRGIINARTLGALPAGAFLINVARGAHVVDADLLAALDSGHIGGAALDAVDPEPMLADHVFWDHPYIRMTPRVASQSSMRLRARLIADDIQRIERGESPRLAMDRSLGY